jgi:ApaG protein
MANTPYQIDVQVKTQYIAQQSAPELDRYVYTYTITLENQGSLPAQLISRHWIITHGNGAVHEVKGEGVVGEQPRLQPGERYTYTSGTVMESAVGTMHGSYQMIASDGHHFDAEIPPFLLSQPNALH